MAHFREEVAGLVPALRAFARALTAGERFMADDLVQDTVVNALQAHGQYQPGTNLEAWLFTILRNRFRSLRARRHVTAEVATDDLAHLATVPALQEHRLEVMAFRQAFSRLPRSQREMLVLVTVRGLSYEAAAGICGCEVGTAKSRVHRARAALKAMLLDDEPAAESTHRHRPSTVHLRASRRLPVHGARIPPNARRSASSAGRPDG
ncbi:MAG: sigma-70 family RNA polymerase sigma factor [Geminicoccaceae bacterium]